MNWPQPPDLEYVELGEEPRAAFEVCLSEYLIGPEDARLPWANKATLYAEKMSSPAWIAVADILVASSAGNSEGLNLVARHLSRALELIRQYRLQGLLVYAMSANLPLIQVQFGLDAAANQAREALKQVMGQTALIRDLVMRRRFLWCFEDAFIEASKYALKTKNTENALEAILLSKGLGWQSSDLAGLEIKKWRRRRRKRDHH